MDFCEGPFWDWKLSWVDTANPDLTQCFQDTVLIWTPCVAFFPFALTEGLIYRKRTIGLPWTILSIAKLIICSVILALLICDLWDVTHLAQGYHAAQFLSPVIQLITMVGVTSFIVFNKVRGMATSLSLFVFWLIYTASTAVRYRSALLGAYDMGSTFVVPTRLRFVLTTFTFVLSAAQFFLHCFADRRCPVSKSSKKTSPENDASILSVLWFWWLNPLIFLGYRRVKKGAGLLMEDMWDLDDRNNTKGVLETFLPIYEAEVAKKRDSEESDGSAVPDLRDRINIVYPLLKTFQWTLLGTAFLKLIASLLVFVPPLILNSLISFVKSEDPLWKGVFLASTMLLSNIVTSCLNNQYEYKVQLIGMRVRSALTHAIYCKALKLSAQAKGQFTTGEIVTLMSVDSQRFVDQVEYVNLLWSVPLQIAIALYLLWQQLGLASLGGVLVIILTLPLNGFIASQFQKNQTNLMEVKDKRTKLMNEILNGIKVLKFYAWEGSFMQRITKFRGTELSALTKEAYLSGMLVFTYSCSPFLVAFASFATYVLIDSSNVLDANTAFVSLSLFNVLNLPMALVPFVISFTAMFIVSLGRVNKYLRSEELDEDAVMKIRGSRTAVSIKDGTFQYARNDSKPVLEDINMEIDRGQLVAVVGAVGTGKSTLLGALLGDIVKKSGTVTVSGSVAYVPQQAWIQGSSIKNNILFGSEYNRARYQEILDSCALRADLAVLPGGDETEVGEKGINLSGGQKQRVSLARAVYADSDIYYFDDPLSAVDSHVSKHIFDKVISHKGILKSKTRILVTHRLSVLSECDVVYVLKGGRISESGTYRELVAHEGAFADFLIQHLQESANADEIPEEDMSVVEGILEEGIVPPHLIRQLSKLSGAGSETASEAGSIRKRGSRFTAARRDSNLETKKAQPGITLTKEEETAVGSVKWKVYKDYLVAMGALGSTIALTAFVFAGAFNICTQLWLSAWSDDSNKPELRNSTSQRNYRLGVYAAWGAGEIFATLAAVIVMNLLALKGSRFLHEKMLHRVLHSPMSFFDTTPMGRILNRFAKDIDTADIDLRYNLENAFQQFFVTVSALLLIAMQTPIFLVLVLPIAIIYLIVQKAYIATSRHLKRIESTSRSPVYVHFSETLTGCTSIRAYGVEKRFIELSNSKTDINHSAYYPSIAATRWLAVYLELFGYSIVFLAAILAVLARDTLTAGYAGLSITAALQITQTLSQVVKSASDVETDFVSVERCLEYSEIEIEADWIIENNRPDPSWPANGAIDFNNFSTRYREDLPLVVKNISLQIQAGEKVGVVGRTGAGKSSLTLSLFRLIEATEGNINIDSLDVSRIGLHDLRSKLTIIPQDPVLFSGTLRENLDPFEEKEDESLWTALERAHLKDFVNGLEQGLAHEVTEGGENMSVGQRQLVCLARALLRKSKILILDEATAAVDMETDDLIQETLMREFKDSTTLTIAHRLNTIINYDRIVVLAEGRVVEYDTPNNLLGDPDSIFHAMAKDAGLV